MYLPLKASISLKSVPKRWLRRVLFPAWEKMDHFLSEKNIDEKFKSLKRAWMY